MGRLKKKIKIEKRRMKGMFHLNSDVSFNLVQAFIETFCWTLNHKSKAINWVNSFNTVLGAGSIELTLNKNVTVGISFLYDQYFEVYAYDENDNMSSIIIDYKTGWSELSQQGGTSAFIDLVPQDFWPGTLIDWEYYGNYNSGEPEWTYKFPLVKWRFDNNEPIIQRNISEYLDLVVLGGRYLTEEKKQPELTTKVISEETCVIHQVRIGRKTLDSNIFSQIMREEIFSEKPNVLNGKALGFINCFESSMDALKPEYKMILWLKNEELRLCLVSLGYDSKDKVYLHYTQVDKVHLNKIHNMSIEHINSLPQIFFNP